MDAAVHAHAPIGLFKCAAVAASSTASYPERGGDALADRI